MSGKFSKFVTEVQVGKEQADEANFNVLAADLDEWAALLGH